MKKVAIYVRVSTLEQAESGYSIGEQIDKLKKYCEIHDWVVYDIYSDPGYSGSNTSRPALSNLCGDAKRKLFDAVLVYKLDRLSRSQKDTLHLIEEVFTPNGIDFVSLNENFDTSTPFGKASIGILAVFAQLEREQIKERMQLGKVGRAKAGKSMMWAKTSFGYDYNKDTGEMTINQAQAVIVRRIFEDYLSGVSVSGIRNKLNEEGYVCRDKPWNYRVIRLILENPVYIGKIRLYGKVYDGLHEPIIDENTFDLVQPELLARQKKTYEENNNPRPFQAKYMVSGIVRCGYCDSPLEIMLGTVRKDGTRYKRYKCKSQHQSKRQGTTVYNNGVPCDGKKYNLEDIESYVVNKISKLQIDETFLFDIIDSKKTDDIDSEILEKQIASIDKKLKKFKDLYISDLFTIDELRENTDVLLSEKKVLEHQINNDDKNAQKLRKDSIKKVLSSQSIKELDYDQQKIMVNKLISKVSVTPDKIDITWKI